MSFSIRMALDSMGGEIGAENGTDVGTTFGIELPLAASLDSAARAEPEAGLGAEERAEPSTMHTILCIKDNLSNGRLVESMVKRQIERQKSAGATEYLTKALAVKEFLRVVEQVMDDGD
ncbi:MAG: hypothetical protein KY445_04625 [Armatimonadetes bacterium]|nr:hypothetical protein [Armatimonadota bacterium]